MYISKYDYYYILEYIKHLREKNKDMELDEYLRDLYLYILEISK